MLWRNPDSVQLEVGTRAVVVDGIGPLVIEQLRRPGGADPVQHQRVLREVRRESGLHRDQLGAVMSVLHRTGFLVRLPQPPGVDAPPVPDRLAADRAALTGRVGERARQVLSQRAGSTVNVHGTGRLTAAVGTLLAAAGVGRIRLADSAAAGLDDAMPGGLTPADEGRRSGLAAADAIRRAAPGAETEVGAHGPSDLSILTLGSPVDTVLQRRLYAQGVPHLVAGVWGATAVVGPLVVPGYSSCLQCADLHRSDRDPVWPALGAQLSLHARWRESSDVAVSALAAAVTVLQALAFLDGESPATVNGTLELSLPDWRLRRRTWAVHPQCSRRHVL